MLLNHEVLKKTNPMPFLQLDLSGSSFFPYLFREIILKYGPRMTEAEISLEDYQRDQFPEFGFSGIPDSFYEKGFEHATELEGSISW